MSKSKKSRGQILGESVCGFVNAQTTDEAYFPILASIQYFFKFSPSFIEEIKKVFPAIRNINPPPRDYMEELKKISSLEDRVVSDLDKKTYVPSYNRHDQSFDTAFGVLGVVGSITSPHLFEDIGFESAKDIIYLQQSWTRFNTIELHKRIQEEQEIVRGILESLILGKPLKQIIHLHRYLELYNDAPKYLIKIHQQDSLEAFYPLSEEEYFKIGGYPLNWLISKKINLPLKWLDRIMNDLAYCLIEFLLSEYQKNLKSCDVCSNFLAYPTRKRCPGECTRIAAKRYDTEYKQYDRWEQFVDDVKIEKCKTIDDFYRNPKLMRRARSFRFGLEGVIERLKASKVLESHS